MTEASIAPANIERWDPYDENSGHVASMTAVQGGGWVRASDHEDVVRELREALTKIADTNAWGQSLHHALNTRIRIATDALAKIAREAAP